MSARTKPTTSTIDALRDEYRQIRRRVLSMVARVRDPNDPRVAKLRQLERAVVEDLRALGAGPDAGDAR
jgi:hypothetical protein